jgi:hypothetical protein
MSTKLERPMKRELSVKGRPFMLTLTPGGFKLTPKGHRNGVELTWNDIVSGEAALATALNASLGKLRPS